MPLTDYLEKNARFCGSDIALVEINPELQESRQVTWKEYSLIETSPMKGYQKELTWIDFDRRANRFANLLLTRGIKKGDKVAILLMNCLEWLPVYFGVMKSERCPYRSISAIRPPRSGTALKNRIPAHWCSDRNS